MSFIGKNFHDFFRDHDYYNTILVRFCFFISHLDQTLNPNYYVIVTLFLSYRSNRSYLASAKLNHVFPFCLVHAFVIAEVGR